MQVLDGLEGHDQIERGVGQGLIAISPRQSGRKRSSVKVRSEAIKSPVAPRPNEIRPTRARCARTKLIFYPIEASSCRLRRSASDRPAVNALMPGQLILTVTIELSSGLPARITHAIPISRDFHSAATGLGRPRGSGGRRGLSVPRHVRGNAFPRIYRGGVGRLLCITQFHRGNHCRRNRRNSGA